VNNIADMALVSFIKIFLTVRKSVELKDYCEMPEI
jgi:class 3 adenylate cyclase